MEGAGILFFGVLVVVAVLAITSAIIAIAPYLAGFVVIAGLFWFAIKFEKDDDPPPDEALKAKPKSNPRK